MSFEFDLTLISCPSCNLTESGMLEVIGKHEFPGSKIHISPHYEIRCRKCNLIFRKQGFLSVC